MPAVGHTGRFWRRQLLAALSLLGAAQCRGEEPAAAETPVFERDVAPILTAYCGKCHGFEARAAGLDLRTLPLIVKGGKSGPVLVRGSAAQSLLVRQIAGGKMPPKGELQPTPAHLEMLRRWIDSGAAARYEGGELSAVDEPPLTSDDRNWWAFRRPVRPAVPAVRQPELVETPIDAFLLAELERHGLGFSEEADRRTLLRRVSFDLTGLPPTPEETAAFLADESPNSYDRLVERLLASPHYGERWGRHWLDAAGYVDTIGTDNDAGIIKLSPAAWRYRDYVIGAFNRDLPYNRFLLEQIAGDELVDWRHASEFTAETRELLVATGFLRTAADTTNEQELNSATTRNQVINDTLQVLGSSVLGLTVHCAQCHTHKFDPISHADYYRLRAVFTPALNPHDWKHSGERYLPDISPAEQQRMAAHNAALDQQVAEAQGELARLREPFARELRKRKLETLPEAIRGDTEAALAQPADKRDAVQKYLADKFGASLAVNDGEVSQALDPAARTRASAIEQKLATLGQSRLSHGQLQALWDVGPPSPAYLHRRGSHETPGPEIRPGVIAVLNDARNPTLLSDPAPNSDTSGYRRQLAEWLTRPDHPLTSRVIVNRVWQQYFGRGIVTTPDNFGVSGARPSHPELLDWLATEFVQEGWSFKHLHRLILRSRAYRQASSRPPAAVATADPAAVDPQNVWLWRMPLRRLESEAIRDAMLAASGKLERSLGGPVTPIVSQTDGMVTVETAKLATPAAEFRRSLYLTIRRNYQLTELSVFDQPLITPNCTRRNSSAVALQSLTLLHGKFAMEQAEFLAERAAQLAREEVLTEIDAAFRLALGRPPAGEEIAASELLLAQQRQRYEGEVGGESPPADAGRRALVHLCHMLLNTNEFLYLE